MALISKRVDDLDGKTLVQEPTRFGFKGVNYTIDLGPANLKALEDFLKPYIEAATQSGLTAVPTATATESDTQIIREWAQAKGLQVADRGRIAQNIRDSYYAEQAQTKTDSKTDSESQTA